MQNSSSREIPGVGGKLSLPRGATDTYLTPYHVNRSKIFVLERGADVSYLDARRLAPG